MYYYRVWVSESHSVVSDSLRPHGLYSPWNCPGQNIEVGSRSLRKGIFPTQGSNPGLPNCRRIPYHLSHRGGIIESTTSHISSPVVTLQWDLWYISSCMFLHKRILSVELPVQRSGMLRLAQSAACAQLCRLPLPAHPSPRQEPPTHCTALGWVKSQRNMSG